MARRVHLILFDVDGTILLSGGAGASALDRAFLALHGVHHGMRHVRPHGKTDVLICQEMFQAHLGREGIPEEIDRLLARYVEELPACVAASRNFHLMPGVPALLDLLSGRADVVLGLGTGNIEPGARIKLGRAGLNHHFPFGGFGSDSVDRAELIEAGFRRGEARIRKERGEAKVIRWVVGDTWRDVAAGHDCGARTVAVATGGDTLYELAEAAPDHIFADFALNGSFPALLDRG